jgi:hypothetical protein
VRRSFIKPAHREVASKARFIEEGIPEDSEGQGRLKEDDALGMVAEAPEAPIVEATSAELATIAVEVPDMAATVEARDVATALQAPDEATALHAPDEALGQRRT